MILKAPSSAASTLRAPLMEIFSSIQGEGAYAGEPQIFVRVARCPLRCLYCDTEESWDVKEKYHVYRGEAFSSYINPANAREIVKHCRALEKEAGQRRTVSLTGGEPLLYPKFIARLAPLLRKEGRRVHLETAGIQPHSLEKVLPHIDHISMDWKLRSTLEYGDYREVQKDFLRASLQHREKDVAVKIVLTDAVTSEEFAEAVGAIVSIDPDVAVILQPVTPARKIRSRLGAEKIHQYLQLAQRKLHRVRVLPQLHPLLKIK